MLNQHTFSYCRVTVNQHTLSFIFHIYFSLYKGVGATRTVLMVSLCGLATALLGLLCFYGVRLLSQDVENRHGASLIRHVC